MPPPERQRRPPGGAAPSATVRISTQSISRSIGTAQLLCLHPRLRQLTNRLWQSGPRLTGELLLEIAAAHGLEAEIMIALEFYGEFGPMAVARLGGRTSPPLPLEVVA
jgi:hypothetical protein